MRDEAGFDSNVFRVIAAGDVQDFRSKGTPCRIGHIINRDATYLHKVWQEEWLYCAFIDAEKLEEFVSSSPRVSVPTVTNSGIVRDRPLRGDECPGTSRSRKDDDYGELGVLSQWEELMNENKLLFVRSLVQSINSSRSEQEDAGGSSTGEPAPRKSPGRPTTIPIEKKRQALAAKKEGKTSKECAQILYGIRYPTNQQVKNVTSILRHFRKTHPGEG